MTRRRVALVDDNSLTLPAFAEALARSEEVEVVAAVGHATAAGWEREWLDMDVLVVDAADEGRAGDQFPGVEIVRRARSAAAADDHELIIIVVTGHSLHDGLRFRMARAGADFYFPRSDLRSPDVLVDVVTHPQRWRRPGVPGLGDPQTLSLLGIDDVVDIEAAIAYADREGLGPALDPESGGRTDPRSRRWSRHRRSMAEAGRIEPVNTTTGNRPLGQDTPSILQLSRLFRWAARVPRDGHDQSQGPS